LAPLSASIYNSGPDSPLLDTSWGLQGPQAPSGCRTGKPNWHLLWPTLVPREAPRA
jgi:hypothetical protein